MNRLKWQGLMSTTGKVDVTAKTISFDDCLTALWDYIGVQRAAIQEDLSKLTRAEVDDMTNGWIDTFLREKIPKVEGFVDEDNNLELRRLYETLSATLTGYDVVQPLIEDPTVTEIQINSYDSVWVERHGKISIACDEITHKPIKFRSPEACLHFINNLLQSTNSQMDTGENKTIGNSITVEGYRVAAIGPASMAADKGRSFRSEKSPACVLRKFSDSVISATQLISWLSESDQMADFIGLLGDNHASVAVAGETGSGKTVNLQTVIDGITDNTRVVSMEKDSELRLRRFDSAGTLINNVIQLEYIVEDANVTYSPTTNTASNLFNQLMRFTPRTIVFGEIRDPKEIQLALTAAEAGHNIMFTIHAGDPAGTIARLATASSKMNPGMQKADIIKGICDTLDIIIIPMQMKDGSRKVGEIAEVLGCKEENGVIVPELRTLYEFRQTGYVVDKTTGKGKVYGEHVQVNRISDTLLDKWAKKGMEPEVRAFLSQEVPEDSVISGTYHGQPSPYKYPPNYTEYNDTDKYINQLLNKGGVSDG